MQATYMGENILKEGDIPRVFTPGAIFLGISPPLWRGGKSPGGQKSCDTGTEYFNIPYWEETKVLK